jgi:hypothetical protein
MKLSRVRTWSMIALSVVCFACGDDKAEDKPLPTERAAILAAAAGQIAQFALGDMPNPDFVAARSRIERSVPQSRTTYTRQFQLGAGRGASVASDPEITGARRAAAAALGTTLDPSKEIDAGGAQSSLDALLAEIKVYAPQATSCDALTGDKAQACAIAFLILEVKRSEGPQSAGDAGIDAGGGDAGDASVTSDAGSSVAPIACGTRDVTGLTAIPTNITTAQTWSGKVLVSGRVLVSQGARITIDPGTEIFMDVDSSIEFGWNSSDATLLANGTPAQPIKFCGKTADRGYWNRILFGSNLTSDSVLRNVLIAEAGGDTAAVQLDADLTVDNLQVVDSGSIGVIASDFKEGSRALTVRNAVGQPVVFETHGAVTRFPLGGTLTGNGEDVAVLSFSSIDADAVVHDLGIPYLQEQRLLQSKGRLLIESGVEWRAAADVTLELGWNNSSTTVQIQGTSAAPVVFRSFSDSASWGGLLVGAQVTTDSKIAYTEVRQAGQGREFGVEIDAKITLDQVTLRNNLKGLSIEAVGLSKDSKGLLITGTQDRPLTVRTNGLFSVPTDSKLDGNTNDQIELAGGSWDETGTISDLGIPYHIAQRWLVSKTAQLTFKPGVEFVMASGVELDLAWNNSATGVTLVGTAADPIKFRGEQDLAGFWVGLRLGAGALQTSRFDYVEIANAGSNDGALEIDREVAITNCKFIKSASYGINKARAITNTYLGVGNTFTDCALGDVGVH